MVFQAHHFLHGDDIGFDFAKNLKNPVRPFAAIHAFALVDVVSSDSQAMHLTRLLDAIPRKAVTRGAQTIIIIKEELLTFDNNYPLIKNVMSFRGADAPQLENFRKACAERGLALTHQRQVIYQALLASGERHPSPEDIYEDVRKTVPSISLGTVYKNIMTFLDAGLVAEVSLHHGSLRLDPNTERHHHLVCVRCKSVTDLPEDDLEPLRLRRKLPRGFRVQRFHVEALGVCESCARKEHE
jgi:Fur family peroxide stress response transcriptional regulator